MHKLFTCRHCVCLQEMHALDCKDTSCVCDDETVWGLHRTIYQGTKPESEYYTYNAGISCYISQINCWDTLQYLTQMRLVWELKSSLLIRKYATTCTVMLLTDYTMAMINPGCACEASCSSLFQ